MKKLFVVLQLLLSVSVLFAQNTITVTGKVTDSKNETVPGVSVLVKGTTQGTITDLEGNYSLSTDPQATLVFSFIGMETQEIAVNSRPSINVQMKVQTIGVDEVVIVGYGSQKVKDLTSAISTVKAEELVKSPSGQAMQALQGKVAGMQVVSGGAPGDAPTIRIRGVGSYPAKDLDGNPLNTESPLYVVDGMLYDNINFLNSSDIATISVLKDASAAAIYGVRAANGVVLIETKSGKFNQKAQISYSGYYGSQVAQNVLKMANAEQFTTMAMESGSAPDIANIARAMQRFGRSRINPNVPNVNTDWYDEIIRVAPIQNHSFDVSGGSQDATYSIGTNYFAQEGILKTKNDYERFNLRTKIDYKATKWLTIGGNFIFSNGIKYGQEKTYSEEKAPWNQAYFAVPILPVYDPDNTDAYPIKYASAQSIGYRGGQNPFPTLEYNNNQLKTRDLLANFYMQIYLIPKKLDFKTTYSHDFTAINQRNVDLPYYVSDGLQLKDASIIRKTETFSKQIWDNILTFTDSFGKHNLSIMGGTSFRDDSWEMLTARGFNFPVDNKESWYIDQSVRSTIPINDVHDDGLRQYGMSYFGRVSYNYNDRYLLYGTFRADGSSKYQDKWGNFPAVGAGWVISEEGFMKDKGMFDFLKLRAGWGRLGNNKIQAAAGSRTTTTLTTAINDQLVTGTTTASTFAYLGWEVTEETNVGLTARMLKNKLSIDADYYIRDTKNAAIFLNIPFIGGSVISNAGVVRNSGFEMTLNWSDELANGLTYTIGTNISTLKNEIRDLRGQPYIDGGMAEFRQRSIVGSPLLAFYGYQVLGVYQNQAQIDADPLAVAYNVANPTSMLVPGDLIYKNQNGDNIINDDDRVVLGSYFPSFVYGFNAGLDFHNFELSINIMGQSGNKILNRKRGEIIWTPDLNMDADLAINRWHGEGTSNKYPSSAGLRKGWNQKMSDYFVEDGKFWRIQNVQLAYNIRETELFGAQMPSARISLTAERPLTVFKYNGFSPEIPDGVDSQTYPIPGVYTVGLSVNF